MNAGKHGFRVVVAAVIEREGTFLLARRRPGSHLEGLWEFPGGGVDGEESPTDALAREIQEELGVTVRVAEPLTFAVHEDATRRVLLLFYRAEVDGEPHGAEGQAVGWFTPADMARLPMPPADGGIVAMLSRRGAAPPR